MPKPAAKTPALKAPLPKDRRAAIEAELTGSYGHVKLRADGHDLTLAVQRYKGLRFVVVLYVDGSVSGENLRLDSPIGAKFYPEKSLRVGATELARYAKDWGKREARKFAERFKERTRHRVAWFSTGRAALLHLMRNCDAIEIVDLPMERFKLKAAQKEAANA